MQKLYKKLTFFSENPLHFIKFCGIIGEVLEKIVAFYAFRSVFSVCAAPKADETALRS